MNGRPRLEACYFGSEPGGMWRRLAAVLEATAQQHCPSWAVRVAHVTPEKRKSALGVPSHVHNTQKMDEWWRLVSTAPIGDRLLLIDADTMICRPLDAVWDHDFDMAYTTKRSRFPFNSGVVFFRITEATKAFVHAWRAENIRMLGDGRYHQMWRKKYGGINQASLGALLDRQADFGLRIHSLPCQEWNCEDSAWADFDPAVTRIVHVKSHVRRVLFGKDKPTPAIRPVLDLWRLVDHQIADETIRRRA